MWTPRIGSSTGGSVSATLSQYGTSIFGTTYYHRFATPIDPETGLSGFTISVEDGTKKTTYTNGGGGYLVQDSVVYLPAESKVSSTAVFVSAAVSSLSGFNDRMLQT